MSQRRIFVLGVLFAMLVSTASAAPYKKIPPRVIAVRVDQLLFASRLAYQRGDREAATREWLQAKAMQPLLNEPPWLQKPLPTDPSATAKAALAPFDLRKTLEAQLGMNPGDRECRTRLLALAMESNDVATIRRHQSILEGSKPNEEPPEFSWGKGVLAIFLFAGIFWQAFLLWKDLWRNQPR